nr:aspartyl protease family protein 2 [Quercus suber]
MSLLWFLESFLLFSSFLASASANTDDDAAQFELFHRHAPQAYKNGTTLGPPKSQLERVKQLVHSDNARQQMISQRLMKSSSHRRKAFEFQVGNNNNYNVQPVDIPMRSAADTGAGQYFVSFRVGSPPQKFVLIADTGSDVTWMNCHYRPSPVCHHGNCPNFDAARRIFHASRSPTFKTIPCVSDLCKFDLSGSFSMDYCPTALSPCEFEYSYADGSIALGIFANETVTVGLGLHKHRKKKLHNVLIGCSQINEGTVHAFDGVMGLGYSKHSFAVRVAKEFGYMFSYCLVDHLSPSNFANYLSFGLKSKGSKLHIMQYTKLILGVINPFYAVNVAGISIGGTMLKIPSEVWDIEGNGGVIIDSGTSLTALPELAYKPVIAALDPHLKNFLKLDIDIEELNYCFNATGFKESLVPKLAFHFADGAQFVPPVKSYVIDADDGVRCLGFTSIKWPGISIIGNIMQQNHFWEFDLLGKKLGFAPSSCTMLKSKV